MGKFIKKSISTFLSLVIAVSSMTVFTGETVFAETIYEFSPPSNIIEGAEDVWDFGPTYIPGANNYISEDDINSMYTEADAGKTGEYMVDSFSAGDMTFRRNYREVETENETAVIEHTLNTSNTNVTRYSSSNKTSNIKAFDCTDLDITGYMSNAYGMGRFYIKLNKNDAVKFYVNERNVHMYNSEGTRLDNYNDVQYENGAVQTFIAQEAGTYYFGTSYTSNIYRITRKNGDYAQVTGDITCADDLTGYTLTFSNDATGFEKQVLITNNSYSIDLPSDMTYSVTLNGGEDYAVEDESIAITATGYVVQNISVQKFEYCTVSGNIIGLSDDELASAEIKFTPTETRKYTPEIIKDGSTYSVKLEKGITYNIEATNIYDYDLATLQITAEVDITKDIVFAPKSTYNVTISPFGCSLEDLVNAVFTFTNADTQVKYTFTGSDNIKLVSGTYSVSVTNSDIYIQQGTNTVNINYADVNINIPFITKWDFVNDSDWKTTILGGVADGNFKGLIFNMDTAQYHSNGSRMQGGTIEIPTGGNSGMLTIGVTYSYDITMPDGVINSDSSGTSYVENLRYYSDGEKPYLTINIGSSPTSYISYISYEPFIDWNVTAPWEGSVFGSSVGDTNADIHTNHDIIEQGNDSVRLVSRNNKGKIASSDDGLVMYFQEIDWSQDFTLTATAHINSYDKTVNQRGFGLMLRDDMIKDYQYYANSPYVAVGNTFSGQTQASVFRRLSDGSLERSVIDNTTITEDTFAQGTEVELTLSKNNNIITVQYGNNSPVEFYDFFDNTDNSKAYVGMFVARTADVSFNNIKLTLSDAEFDSIFNNSPKDFNGLNSNDGWEIVNDNDTFYAVSTNHTDNSSSALSITVDDSCVLYYEMAVSSEGSADVYTISKNGSVLQEMSGKSTYTMDSPYANYVVLNTGDTIEWKYSKDGSDSIGQDCAWLKNLRVTELGDVNLDGKVNITDAVMSQKYAGNINDVTDILIKGAADMDLNGVIEKDDSAAILRKIIENI